MILDRLAPRLLTALVVAASGFGLLSMAIGDYDDSILLMGARLMRQDAVPYLDFYTHYGPFGFTLLSTLTHLFGDPALALRIGEIILLPLLRSAAAFGLAAAAFGQEEQGEWGHAAESGEPQQQEPSSRKRKAQEGNEVGVVRSGPVVIELRGSAALRGSPTHSRFVERAPRYRTLESHRRRMFSFARGCLPPRRRSRLAPAVAACSDHSAAFRLLRTFFGAGLK